MARWLVRLAGELMDLEEYPRRFPEGDVFSFVENGEFYIAGKSLDALSSSQAVFDEATRALNRFTGVISLLWPNLNQPTIDRVVREQDDGGRDIFVGLTGVSVRTKAGSVGASSGRSPEPVQPTQAQEMLEQIIPGSGLDTAISLWAEPSRSWGRLYRILEEIEQHLQTTADAAGLCTGAERTRFMRTANTAEVAGADARHAAGKFTPPTTAMTEAEGAAFVRRLLTAVLR